MFHVLQKLTSVKAQLQEITDLYNQCSQDSLAHCSQQEGVAHHVKDLVAKAWKEWEAHEQPELDLNRVNKEHNSELCCEPRSLEAKESSLQSALNDLTRMQFLLMQRELDLAAVQSSLQGRWRDQHSIKNRSNSNSQVCMRPSWTHMDFLQTKQGLRWQSHLDATS